VVSAGSCSYIHVTEIKLLLLLQLALEHCDCDEHCSREVSSVKGYLPER